MRKCSNCQINKANAADQISFQYEGLNFAVKGSEVWCTDCEKKDAIEMFEKYKKELFVEYRGHDLRVNWKHLRVNWKHFSRLEQKRFGGGYLMAAKVLENIGILSALSTAGSWKIVATDSLNLNPRSIFGHFYFTRREDVIEYARVNYSGTFYHWVIYQIGEIIDDKDVVAP